LFRNFQKNHQFNTPGSVTILQNDNSTEKVSALQFPILIKPSDSSGSKGISKIEKYSELQPAIDLALSFSRNKRIVAEEFIECDGAQLHGDGFIKDGKLVFAYLGDHHFNTFINPFVPCSTTWPSTKPSETIKLVEIEINRLISEVGFLNGPINIEVRINKEGKIYIGEIGPRSGGNYVPQAINYATGFDMVKATLDVLSDSKIIINPNLNKFSANYVIHSEKEGNLEELLIDKELNPFIKEFHQYCFKGDKINTYQNSSAAIGLMLLQFNNRESMDFYMTSIEKYINLKIV
jgi:biotin carboxylase